MKKIVVFLILASIVSCESKEDLGVDCDAVYTTEFFIENETGKEIVVSNDTQNGSHEETIPPGDNSLIDSRSQLGPCDSETLMEDKVPDDYRINAGGALKYPFTMTIDGEEVSSDIWLRKYWSFTPGYYSWTYTLTVTDGLLAELAEAGE